MALFISAVFGVLSDDGSFHFRYFCSAIVKNTQGHFSTFFHPGFYSPFSAISSFLCLRFVLSVSLGFHFFHSDFSTRRPWAMFHNSRAGVILQASLQKTIAQQEHCKDSRRLEILTFMADRASHFHIGRSTSQDKTREDSAKEFSSSLEVWFLQDEMWRESRRGRKKEHKQRVLVAWK